MLQALRHLGTRPETPIWLYLPLTATAELLISRFGSELGLLLQALLIAALSYRVAIEGPGPRRNLILATLLVPFSRLLMTAQFIAPVSQSVWNLIVAGVLAAAASVVLWQVRLPYEELGWGSVASTSTTSMFRAPRFQVLLGAGGLGLGLLESRYVSAGRMAGPSGFFAFFLAAFALVVLTGFLGELIFRGLVLNTALSEMKGWGLVYATLLFVALRAGHRPLADLILAFAAGLLFAYVARSTHSLLGVSLAHGLATVVGLLVAPTLASTSPGILVILASGLLWLGAAIGLGAFGILAWCGTIHPAIQSDSLRKIRDRTSREEINRIQRDLVRRSQTLATPVDPSDDWRAPSDGVSGEATEWSRTLRDAVIQASRRGVATQRSIRDVVETTAQPIQRILESLQETFTAIPDPRAPRGRRQPLPLVLSLATYAMLYGAESVYSVTRWLRGEHPEVLAQTSNGETKAPAPSTFHRIFNRIDALAFETALRNWARENLAGGEEALVVDDHILRGVHGTPLPGVRLADGYEPAKTLDPLVSEPHCQPKNSRPAKTPKD